MDDQPCMENTQYWPKLSAAMSAKLSPARNVDKANQNNATNTKDSSGSALNMVTVCHINYNLSDWLMLHFLCSALTLFTNTKSVK